MAYYTLYKENKMKSINNMLLGLFFVIFMPGCATVGMAIDGGKELVTNTVDTVVSTTSDITVAVASDVSDISTTALEVGAGVVKTTTSAACELSLETTSPLNCSAMISPISSAIIN